MRNASNGRRQRQPSDGDKHVLCGNAQRGCPWTGKGRRLHHHMLEKCRFTTDDNSEEPTVFTLWFSSPSLA